MQCLFNEITPQTICKTYKWGYACVPGESSRPWGASWPGTRPCGTGTAHRCGEGSAALHTAIGAGGLQLIFQEPSRRKHLL